MPEFQELKDLLHDHAIDDDVRFKAIGEKLDDALSILHGQNNDMQKLSAKLEPFLQGAAGFGILWKIAIAIGGLLVIWVQVKSLFGR